MYADKAYYLGDFGGTLIPSDSIETYLGRAGMDIDTLTFHRIPPLQAQSRLTAFQSEQIKKAECCQAEYLFNYGDMIDLPLTGYNMTDYSVSMKTGGTEYSGQCRKCLLATGLLNRRLA